MAIVTRPGPHGTTMKPYVSFAGKSPEGGSAIVVFMMQTANQFNGGLVKQKKRK